jgi:hypothetical protein
MSGSASLFSVCSNERNNGVSVWMVGHSETTQIILQPRGVPRFNSNNCYVAIKQSINKTVLIDKPTNEFRVFFWIGTYAEDYDNNFEQVIE